VRFALDFAFGGKILTRSGLSMYSVCASITNCSKLNGSILLSSIILDMDFVIHFIICEVYEFL
jgi:hypothetical protein